MYKTISEIVKQSRDNTSELKNVLVHFAESYIGCRVIFKFSPIDVQLQGNQNQSAQAEPAQEQEWQLFPDDVRGNPIYVPEAGVGAARGRREQLYTLLRRNEETTDRLLIGRLLELTDVQLNF